MPCSTGKVAALPPVMGGPPQCHQPPAQLSGPGSMQIPLNSISLTAEEIALLLPCAHRILAPKTLPVAACEGLCPAGKLRENG